MVKTERSEVNGHPWLHIQFKARCRIQETLSQEEKEEERKTNKNKTNKTKSLRSIMLENYPTLTRNGNPFLHIDSLVL